MFLVAADGVRVDGAFKEVEDEVCIGLMMTNFLLTVKFGAGVFIVAVVDVVVVLVVVVVVFVVVVVGRGGVAVVEVSLLVTTESVTTVLAIVDILKEFSGI